MTRVMSSTAKIVGRAYILQSILQRIKSAECEMTRAMSSTAKIVGRTYCYFYLALLCVSFIPAPLA